MRRVGGVAYRVLDVAILYVCGYATLGLRMRTHIQGDAMPNSWCLCTVDTERCERNSMNSNMTSYIFLGALSNAITRALFHGEQAHRIRNCLTATVPRVMIRALRPVPPTPPMPASRIRVCPLGSASAFCPVPFAV